MPALCWLNGVVKRGPESVRGHGVGVQVEIEGGRHFEAPIAGSCANAFRQAPQGVALLDVRRAEFNGLAGGHPQRHRAEGVAHVIERRELDDAGKGVSVDKTKDAGTGRGRGWQKWQGVDANGRRSGAEPGESRVCRCVGVACLGRCEEGVTARARFVAGAGTRVPQSHHIGQAGALLAGRNRRVRRRRRHRDRTHGRSARCCLGRCVGRGVGNRLRLQPRVCPLSFLLVSPPRLLRLQASHGNLLLGEKCLLRQPNVIHPVARRRHCGTNAQDRRQRRKRKGSHVKTPVRYGSAPLR